MKIRPVVVGALALAICSPLAAQPTANNVPAPAAELSDEKLEERRKMFAWLLGTWQADHMYGPQSSRNGAQVTFLLEPDGTVSARLDRMSPWMEGSEERFKDLVGKRFIRGINASGAPRHVWTHSASGGWVFNKNTGEWVKLGIISIDRQTGQLSHLGAMSDFSHWVKVSGAASSQSPSAQQPASPSGESTSTPSATPANRDAATPREAKPDEADSRKRCDYSFYSILVGESTSSVLKQFDHDLDEVSSYDPDLPSARMYPSPLKSAADIPVSHMDFADYRVLTGMEEITGPVIANGGPDTQLLEGARKIRALFGDARQQYDLSARISDQRKAPCPLFSDPDAYALVAQADALMAELRKRRHEVLAPQLADGERLNEKLTGAFYGELADASSLDEKQSKFLSELQEKAFTQLKGRLSGEAIEPAKVEALVPQLEDLRERYSAREAQGQVISQEQRDKDLKEALKKSGINFDPATATKAKRDGRYNMSKAFYGYLMSVMGPPATGISGYFGKAQSYFAAVKVTAEVLNALKNLYTLVGVRDDLMPVALAVQENRAYLDGLVKRYDIFEQEYAIMRRNFEHSVTEGGALSETE